MYTRKSQEARERLRSAFSTMMSQGSIVEEPEFEPGEEFEVVSEASGGFKSTRPVMTLANAREYAELGRFNLWLMATCGGTIFVRQFLPIYLHYNIDVVDCDLRINRDKDRAFVNAMVYTGITLGALVMGVFADIYGRNIVLASALALNLCGTILVALRGNFATFWLGRLVASFGGSGASVVAIVILAEYNPPQHRAAAMCSMQLFWAVGTVAGPVLNMWWEATTLLSCSMIVVLIFCVLGMPENPRFLLSTGDNQRAFNSLRVMYAHNTGNRETDYPLQGVVDDETIAHMRARGGEKSVPEYMKPRSYNYLILVVIHFFILFSFYCLMPYFPDLPSRYEAFYMLKDYVYAGVVDSCELGGDRSGLILDDYHADVSSRGSGWNETSQDCYSPNDQQTNHDRRLQRFVMVAFSGLPAVVWLVMSIDTQGRKFFVAFSHVIAAAVIYSAYFLMVTRYELVFACSFQAMLTLSVAAGQVLVVELSRTRRRATTLAAWFVGGYLGLILGNLGVVLPFQISCNILLGVLGIMVSFTGMFAFLFPDTVGMTLRQ